MTPLITMIMELEPGRVSVPSPGALEASDEG